MPPRSILVIDHNPDSGHLLVRTLLRKFPEAGIEMITDAETAVAAARSTSVDAIVLHRTLEEDAVSLIRMLRVVSPTIPIIAVSAIDRTGVVIAAGATAFLNYDEWLRIGTVVAEALQRRSPEADVVE